jgi:uncharacterized membrane protein
MNHSKFNHHRDAAFPVIALLLASAAGTVLIVTRIALTGRWQLGFLVWNLFLAWLPLAFALGVCRLHRAGVRHGWKLGTLAALWLLFFPNAPYIFTDLIHLNTWFRGHYWVDLTLILMFGLTGFMLGFLSLYLMQSVVAARFGRIVSWLFILAATGLGGLGIYVGRFLRWNSWDILLHPVGLTLDLGHLAAHPLANRHSLFFAALFATFLFFGYLMLYALTHLPPAQREEAISV